MDKGWMNEEKMGRTAAKAKPKKKRRIGKERRRKKRKHVKWNDDEKMLCVWGLKPKSRRVEMKLTENQNQH